jgi:hypothetical protein
VSNYRSKNRTHEREVFYKYMTAKVAKIVLKDLKLRWSSPLLFNDPFDVPRDLHFGFDARDLQAAIAEELAQLIEEDKPSHEPRVTTLLQLLRDRGNADLRRLIANDLRESPATPVSESSFDGFRNHWSQLVPETRILCVSEDNSITSMWNHYADRYRGVVLEFPCVDELDSPLLLARAVTYQATPPSLPSKLAFARSIIGQEELDLREFFSDYQYVKSIDWSYEREWRVVSYARPGESGLFADYSFHPRELGGIYLGPEIADQDAADILSLIKHEIGHVSVHRAKLMPGAARFTFDRIQ